MRAFQYGVAKQLGINPKHVRVISSFIGGAFGSRGELGQATALIAHAARWLGRPVKLVATRRQGFTLRTFRAETRHHLRLGAERNGQLTALSHDGWEMTGREVHFALAGSDATARLYACPNIRTKVLNVEADRQPPGFMRAPPEVPYLFAMESAMDELACALDLDPLDLRRRNDTLHEPIKGLPYTSRSLLPCIDAGAAAFRWENRRPRPGSMREGHELVGYGYATAFYPTMMGPADARVTLTPEGRAKVEVGTHEIGTGIRTVLAQTVADRLGVAVEAVEVVIGDSRLPAAALTAGSNSTASVCTAVALACEPVRERVVRAAVKAKDSPLYGRDAAQVVLRDGRANVDGWSEPLTAAVRRAGRGRALVGDASNNPHGGIPVLGPLLVRRGVPVITGGSMLKDRVQFAIGAHFVEVRVDRHTGQIRVPRMVGAFAAGRIMNPRTARSQLMGGQIWGPVQRAARSDRDRPAVGPLRQQRSGRVPRARPRGHRAHRDHHGARGGYAGEPAGHQRGGRAGHHRRQRGGRQRRLPCDRRARARTADPRRPAPGQRFSELRKRCETANKVCWIANVSGMNRRVVRYFLPGRIFRLPLLCMRYTPPL